MTPREKLNKAIKKLRTSVPKDGKELDFGIFMHQVILAQCDSDTIDKIADDISDWIDKYCN